MIKIFYEHVRLIIKHVANKLKFIYLIHLTIALYTVLLYEKRNISKESQFLSPY